MYVVFYLVAIVLANLSVAHFGPASAPVNAFVLIAFDLVARDKLHDAWNRKGLWWKMALLIAAGSLLSWVLNRNAGQIAIASFAAFALAGVADTAVYWALGDKAKLLRVNGSNVVSAAVDSLVFVRLAFSAWIWPIILLQFAAKVVGGLVWSLLLNWTWRPLVIESL